MRSREAGFTLIEVAIAVAIAVVLLAAGGVWMLSMQPGALRSAVNGVDADFAAAQAIAESSGNGATLVFAPRSGGASGFTLRVYSGRPNAADAVTNATVMAVTSVTSIREAHFGSPPFSLFLSSAGYATGTANYPQFDAQGNPSFAVIASQPPCPPGGITLTFTSPQGATATRTYACNTLVAGTSAADATPTPNPPRISPTYLLAHDTSDAGPLRFKAAEYGYYHWYASAQNGAACQTIASQTGAAPASFASPWPYAQPSPAAQSGASPAPPAFAPYTWPNGDPNDPPAWFQLAPVQHDGGMCTVTVADDYGQSGTVTVQVMGDLTSSTTSLTLQAGKGAQTVAFTKVFDSEKLLLSAGGPCLGIVTVTTASGSFPPSPSNTPANATVTVTPVAKGSCMLQVQDQYGEVVPIAIDVKAQDFKTWPASLVVGVGGAAVGTTSGTLADADTPVVVRIAPVLNALLGGGVARAAGYSGPCYAQAFDSGTSGAIDTSIFTNDPAAASALGITVTTDGCILNASGTEPYGWNGTNGTGVIVAYEPAGSGQTGTFGHGGCSVVTFGSWIPNLGRDDAQASLSATGSAEGSCTVDFSDGTSTQTPAPDAGAASVTSITGCVVGQVCGVVIYQIVNQCITDAGFTTFSYAAETLYYTSTDGGSTWTESWNAAHSYGSGHIVGNDCPGPSETEVITAAGSPPEGDPYSWTATRTITNGDSTALTWNPPSVPSYVTAYFGE